MVVLEEGAGATVVSVVPDYLYKGDLLVHPLPHPLAA